MEKGKYGVATVGVGTTMPREINIESFLKLELHDHRLCSCIKLEDNSYVLSCENPNSTGRATEATIWLSEKSLLGVLMSAHMHFMAQGIDLMELTTESSKNDSFDYYFSDNMIDPFKK